MAEFDEEAVRNDVDKVFGNRPKHEGPERFQTNAHSSVKHVIGVISGKGGVGKSLVCGILATELRRRGHKVGVLDADITGPSIPKMFGLSNERAKGANDMILPVTSSTSTTEYFFPRSKGRTIDMARLASPAASEAFAIRTVFVRSSFRSASSITISLAKSPATMVM